MFHEGGCIAADSVKISFTSLKTYQICVLFETKVASVLYRWEHKKTPSPVHFSLYFCTLARTNNDNLVSESESRKTCENGALFGAFQIVYILKRYNFVIFYLEQLGKKFL